jgi:type IV secretion system protein VirB10
MANPAELTAVEKPPVFNRSRLLKIAGVSVACIAALGVLLNTGGKNKGKQPAQADGLAPNVRVPDFGDYKSRAEQSPVSATGDPPAAFPAPPPPGGEPEINTYYPERERVTVYAGTPASAPPPGNRNKTVRETAEESPLIPEIQGSLFTIPPQQPNQSSGTGTPRPAAPGQVPAFPDFSGAFASGNASSYDTQNMQANKQSFYAGNAAGGNAVITGLFLQPDTLWNGTVIPAVLITGINTDLPGDVQARVTQNMYDSQTGKHLLIPQGTILIASYNSSVSFAQSRVQIVWNTLIRPDGFQLNLEGMNAVDAQGYSGVKGWYSENLFQYAKAMGIISLFSVLNGYVSQTLDAGNNPLYQDMIIANQNVINQLGTRIIDKALDIQPTITVKNGTQINIMLNKNLLLPPVDDYRVAAKYVRR